MTFSESSPFSLHRFNAATNKLFNFSGGTFTLTGNINGGGTITETFTFLDRGQWDLYTLSSEWQNLDSVDFLATTTHLHFDNISVSQVPVPAAVWLFGSGLMGLLGMKKKASKFLYFQPKEEKKSTFLERGFDSPYKGVLKLAL